MNQEIGQVSSSLRGLQIDSIAVIVNQSLPLLVVLQVCALLYF